MRQFPSFAYAYIELVESGGARGLAGLALLVKLLIRRRSWFHFCAQQYQGVLQQITITTLHTVRE
jgi:hypothetical protein